MVTVEAGSGRAIAASAAEMAGPLEPMGRRAGADRGDPQVGLRRIHVAADGSVEVGVWECTPGGWPIVDRGDTEFASILAGRATITDADGTRHDLGPGDAITLPIGWSGRWEIAETVRKLYVVVRPSPAGRADG